MGSSLTLNSGSRALTISLGESGTNISLGASGGNPVVTVPPAWDDLQVLQSTKTTANSATFVNFLSIGGFTIQQLAFAKNGNNYIDFTSQMPHTWQTGSTVVPHIHWAVTTPMNGATGGFRIIWEIRQINDVFTGVTGSNAFVDNLVIGPIETAYKHNIGSFGPASLSVINGPSAIIMGRLSRTDTTFSSNIFLIGFDFHILKDKAAGDTGAFGQ
jgi:hypothetical protein